jgi:pyrimidine operon attenuation protein / uracil phosphoribosyltransferase
MNRIKQILDTAEVHLALTAMAQKIVEDVGTRQDLLLMGLATRGIPLAERLAKDLAERLGRRISVGKLDATFYRDDYHYRGKLTNPKMRIIHAPLNIEDAHVILVDDVFYTGRSTRAAMEALFDLGRPNRVQLAVLCDRGHRELPLHPDFVGVKFETLRNQEVQVRITPHDEEDSVWLVEV